MDDDTIDSNIATADVPTDAPADDVPIDDRAAALEAWKRQRASAPRSRSAAVVEVVSADDPPATGFGAKLRGFIANGGASSGSDEDDAPRRGRRAGTKPEDVAQGIIVPLLAIAFLAVPPHVRMQQDEMQATALPLARILLRRIRALRRMSPDVIDLFAIIAAITVYVRRLQVEAEQRKAQIRAVEEQRRAAANHGGNPSRAAAGNGFAFTGGDPLAAYLSGSAG